MIRIGIGTLNAIVPPGFENGSSPPDGFSAEDGQYREQAQSHADPKIGSSEPEVEYVMPGR